jgi:hypothetical protein
MNENMAPRKKMVNVATLRRPVVNLGRIAGEKATSH